MRRLAVGALQFALGALHSAVTGLGNGGSVTAGVTEPGGVATAGRNLLEAATTRRPSASPSS